ncbi:MAG: phosphoribosylformylglycinamidine cyclo-ligase [Candidatus Diapherotrites archaeon]
MGGATYGAAGVDIEKGNSIVRGIKGLAESTHNKSVLTGIGLFGGVVDASRLKKYKNPVLVSSIDGVGTKLTVAAMAGKWDTVGIDLVNHSANDIATLGAEPLFFLDYVAGAKLEQNVVVEIVKGMAGACRELGMPLVGGETAEMPGVYNEGEYDLAGCIVGVAEKGKLLTGEKIRAGDVLISLPSNGLHTNGYSLARKVLFQDAGYDVGTHLPELGTTVGAALLAPHTCYSKAVLALNKKGLLKGAAHITGGGITDNLPRILPNGLGAGIETASLHVPPIFKLIKGKGNVSHDEMFRTFNMGVGMILVVSAKHAKAAARELANKYKTKAQVIGSVVNGNGVNYA